MYLELQILDGKEADQTVEDIRRIVAKAGKDSHPGAPARGTYHGGKRN